MLAARSTSPKLEQHALQRGCPVAAAIRIPRFIGPHRPPSSGRMTRSGAIQSACSATLRHTVNARHTQLVARTGNAVQSQNDDRGQPRLHPAEGMPRRRYFDAGGSGLSGRWALRAPSPAPSPRRTKREATLAAFSTTSVLTPRWLWSHTIAGVARPPLALPQHRFLVVPDMPGTPMNRIVSTLRVGKPRLNSA